MGLNTVRTAQDVSRACGGQSGAGATQPPAQAPAQSQFALRAHDAWALPIDVVRDALGVMFFEQELFDDFQACLISRRGRTIVITAPGLTAEMKQHAVRRLFSEHIANGWAAVSVDSEERVKFAESLDAEADPEGGSVGVPASTALAQADVRGLYEGSAYVPLHGWRDDEEGPRRHPQCPPS